MNRFRRYIRKYGIPIEEAITNRKATVKEHTNRTMKTIHNGKSMKFKGIQQGPEIKTDKLKIKRRRATTYLPERCSQSGIPPRDYLWRKTYGKLTAKINNPPLEAAA